MCLQPSLPSAVFFPCTGCTVHKVLQGVLHIWHGLRCCRCNLPAKEWRLVGCTKIEGGAGGGGGGVTAYAGIPQIQLPLFRRVSLQATHVLRVYSQYMGVLQWKTSPWNGLCIKLIPFLGSFPYCRVNSEGHPTISQVLKFFARSWELLCLKGIKRRWGESDALHF